MTLSDKVAKQLRLVVVVVEYTTKLVRSYLCTTHHVTHWKKKQGKTETRIFILPALRPEDEQPMEPHEPKTFG